jgi:hypothetical protein
MKPISVYVPEGAYQDMKALAAGSGRPVSELIRQAMAEYVERQRRQGGSVLDVHVHRSGRMRRTWSREDLLDEMRGR